MGCFFLKLIRKKMLCFAYRLIDLFQNDDFPQTSYKSRMPSMPFCGCTRMSTRWRFRKQRIIRVRIIINPTCSCLVTLC